jgi:transposase-like protein
VKWSSFALLLISRFTSIAKEARRVLMTLRWPATGGRPVCPKCGCDEVYALRVRPCFRCKRCPRDFSVTSGTIFASSKISSRDILLAACLFVGGAKGISSLQLGRYFGRQQKTTFVLEHKFREAMQRPEFALSGVVQVDGCRIGGHRIAENTRK